MTGIRVLLVHPDGGWCQALGDALRCRGLEVVIATSTEDAMAALQITPIGALVVDVQVCTAASPGLAGWIETHLPTLPVAYLLRARRVEDVVRAIQDGCMDVIVLSDDAGATADDIAAMLARHHRRISEYWLLQNILAMASNLADAESPSPPSRTSDRIAVGHVQLNRDEQTVVVAEPGRPVRRVRLTPAECQLLAALMSQAGRVVSIEDLARGALDYRHGGRNVANAVRHHVVRLREKIESRPDQPVLIHTVRGRGYVFDPHRVV